MDIKNQVWSADNKIYFFADFEEETVNLLIRLIEKNSSKKNLKLILKSYGGYVDEFRALVDLIIKYEISVHVVGYAMSAGFYLWCAAPVRTMEPSAKLMYHEMLYGSGHQTLEDHKAKTKISIKEQSWLDSLVVATGGFTQEELDEIKKSRENDYYFFFEEALERKMISEVIYEKTTKFSVDKVEVE